MISVRLKPVLRMLLLLWMHFSLALCAANSIHPKYKAPSIVAESTRTESSSARGDFHLTAGSLLQKNETSQPPLHRSTQVQQIEKKLTNSNQPTVQQLPLMETAPSTDQSVEMVDEISGFHPLTVEIGPRITLDTLPICGSGFKLLGNHCRKEA
ncbi:uncharacterized protein LOC108655028 [Drosophila navojoa]|uniref:uncharacterized protein LOC108655028 n=1 Tax=Drosophila navojoa TaxID=7232 RepID=UPI000846DFD9|nr:uncharacterized protein LOC108655028 [Drosophila navojoa]